SQMGLCSRPRQEQLDGLAQQFDIAHQQMKQRKAAAMGATAAPAAAAAPSASASRTWGETITDTGARALRGAAGIGPALGNAGLEVLKAGPALAAGLGLIDQETAFNFFDEVRPIQNRLVEGGAEVRDSITN